MCQFFLSALFVAAGIGLYFLAAVLSEKYSSLVVTGGILLAGTIWGLLIA